MLKEVAPVEVVYFEMNNWFAERNYPNDEPFRTWMANDLKLTLADSNWVEANHLVVVCHYVDMAVNFMVSAPKEWVEHNCPKLLTDYTKFLRYPDENGEVIGHFGTRFRRWSDASSGVYWIDYDYWKEEEEDEDDADDN